MTECTEACEHMPECLVCGMRKSPLGRSVAPEAAGGYCDSDCVGYYSEPKPGHLWPGELQQLRAPEEQNADG